MAVMKEYNIERHCETKHQDRYKHVDRQQKVGELKETHGVTADYVHKSYKSQSEAVS